MEDKIIYINNGTVGHVDHGKTTLTAAITKVLSKIYGAKAAQLGIAVNNMSVDDIDNTPEEKGRGITISSRSIQYCVVHNNTTYVYAHTDCPGHIDYINNMIRGSASFDFAILVVSATDGVMPQTKEHVLLCKNTGISHIAVFINKVDACDPDLVELVEEEVREILAYHGFIRDQDGFRASDLIVAHGSGLKAYEGDTQYEQVIVDFFNKLIHLPLKPRKFELPFLLSIDSVLSIQGRGTVVTGCIDQGKVKMGDALEIVGIVNSTQPERIPVTVTGVESFHREVKLAEAGRNVGLLVKGVDKMEVVRGMILCEPKSLEYYSYFKATAIILTADQGGRHTPIRNGYRPQFFIRTDDVTGTIFFSEDMLYPDAEKQYTIYIALEKKYPLSVGLSFAIREGGKTIGSGIINEVSKTVFGPIPVEKTIGG